MSIKRTLRRWLSSSNQKSKKKPHKEQETGDLVYDSVPDYAPSPKNEKNILGGLEKNFSSKNVTEIDYESEISDYETKEKEEKIKNKNEKPYVLDDEKVKKKSSNKERKKKSAPHEPFTNYNKINNQFNISQTEEVHIGVKNNFYFGPNSRNDVHQKAKKNRNLGLTKNIEDILHCEHPLTTPHMACLSKQFGDDWRKIGHELKLSEGELDNIQHQFEDEKDLTEFGYQMLLKWYQKRGEKATVGKLCSKLWESNIPNAQDAVKELSSKFKNLI